VFQMFAHGVMTGLFFALVGLVYEKAHSREIFRMGGFGRVMPGIATAFTIGGLSSLGLPGTSGFVAEILTFMGAWRSDFPWWLLPAVAGTFLTAVYVLRVAKQIFWGPPSPHFHHLEDARGPEWVALVLLVGVLVVFGFAPGLALVPVDTATVPLLSGLGSPDRALARRGTEYHLLLLASLLGMLVLASARDLIVLFVAFELMSIPLYILTGFAKREPEPIEASLKFFLVGSVSSAVMAYGLSFVYGATGSTSLAAIARAPASPLLTLGLLAALAG